MAIALDSKGKDVGWRWRVRGDKCLEDACLPRLEEVGHYASQKRNTRLRLANLLRLILTCVRDLTRSCDLWRRIVLRLSAVCRGSQAKAHVLSKPRCQEGKPHDRTCLEYVCRLSQFTFKPLHTPLTANKLAKLNNFLES